MDTKQAISLQLSGKAVVANVQMEASVFDFGECPVHDRRDISTSISNGGSDLSARWFIDRVAQFNFKPSKGILHPGQSQNINVSFKPTQLGRFHKNVNVQIENGASILPLRLVGTSETIGKSRRKIIGGPNAIPEDFKPKSKKVIQDDESMNMSPKKKFRRNMPWEDSLAETTEETGERNRYWNNP